MLVLKDTLTGPVKLPPLGVIPGVATARLLGLEDDVEDVVRDWLVLVVVDEVDDCWVTVG